MSVTLVFADRQNVSSSAGRINFLNSCVPFGSKLSTYSAPTIANIHDFGLRLIVERLIQDVERVPVLPGKSPHQTILRANRRSLQQRRTNTQVWLRYQAHEVWPRIGLRRPNRCQPPLHRARPLTLPECRHRSPRPVPVCHSIWNAHQSS